MTELPAANATTLWSSSTSINVSQALPSMCVITSSSDGAGDLISPETELLVSKLKSAVFIPMISAFGVPANVFNILVFLKQGLRDRVNLCLFSLAVVDFLAVSFFFLVYCEHMFIFNSPDTHGPVFAFFANNKIMLFYSSIYSSMFLSAIIALERCFCVLFPLRAKTLLKTKSMAVIILTGVLVTSFLRLAVMAKYEVSCFFDTRRQLTFKGLYVTDYQARNKQFLEIVDVIFYGFVVAVGCPVIVLVSTVMTSVKLWQSVTWRKQTSIGIDSKKETAVTKMLILLSAQFLTFTIPVVFLRIYPLFNAEFSARGRYRLFFLAFSNIAEVFTQMAMSFSFVVYYVASTRYRKTFRTLSKRKMMFNTLCKR